MKKSEALLAISNKLQKQIHLINSQTMRDNPKMLCDNLASRIMTELEELGFLPPLNENQYHFMDNDARIDINTSKWYYSWEKEEDEIE